MSAIPARVVPASGAGEPPSSEAQPPASKRSPWLVLGAGAALLTPLVIMGIGMGCVWAPIAAIAMRRVEPHATGAASGVLSTAGQLGDLLGAAVVGAILENRLASSLPSASYAVSYVDALPPTLSAPIVVLLAGSVSCVAIVGHVRNRGY